MKQGTDRDISIPKNTHHDGILLFIIALLTLFCSLWSPTGNFTEFPKYWWDEAFTVEIARTFMETGYFDVTVAPNMPSGKAIALNANGFPVSLPLAGVFSLFGVGVIQARVYMVFWIFATILLVYFFLKKLFDTPSALAGILLIVTFASFYGNGRTATGDIPGFFFLVGALYAAFAKERYFLAGLLFGLAAVTKTSVFHMTLPAIAVTLLLFEQKKFLGPLLKVALGSGTIIFLWFALLLPRPYSLMSFQPLVDFYKNPTNKASLLERIPESIPEILFSSTIIYFTILSFLLICAYRKSAFDSKQKRVVAFTLLYGFLQIIVFLRSPGWIRYLIGIQLLLLMLFYPTVRHLFQLYLPKITAISEKKALLVSIGTLAILQSVQYLFFSNIFSKPDPERDARAITALLDTKPGSTIGFYESPEISSLISGHRKYQTVRVGGNVWAGKDPLSYPPDQLPTYHWNEFDETYRPILEKYYTRITLDGGTILWKKK